MRIIIHTRIITKTSLNYEAKTTVKLLMANYCAEKCVMLMFGRKTIYGKTVRCKRQIYFMH